ncbi:hypothetical protein HJG60_007821 [Phyllostomus discolor]|uniref:Uncharacterized protein n=1 Tax=Phyllostomus discolor TaxID=89673 RepID=A0A834BDT4_9CHIR|nr:hypothetical protein HJG60_007821 [Phyllostomus discolor]
MSLFFILHSWIPSGQTLYASFSLFSSLGHLICSVQIKIFTSILDHILSLTSYIQPIRKSSCLYIQKIYSLYLTISVTTIFSKLPVFIDWTSATLPNSLPYCYSHPQYILPVEVGAILQKCKLDHTMHLLKILQSIPCDLE